MCMCLRTPRLTRARSCSFFRYCQDHLHPDKAERPEDALLSQPPAGDRAPSPAHSSGTNDSSAGALVKEGAEIELVSDYSWRNFFSTINFVHILQKLTKRKTHRVLLMVQYKSSVCLALFEGGPGRVLTRLLLAPTGHPETDPQGLAPNASALRPQGHQESSAVLRSQMAAV